MKVTSWSSRVLKIAANEADLNPFGFVDFEDCASANPASGGSRTGLPKEVQKEIERKLREIEEKEAIAEKRGYERGYRQGEKDGRKVGKQSMEIVARQLATLVENLNNLPVEIAQKYTDLIKRVICDTIKKVLQVEISENNTVLMKSLEMAFEALNETHKVVIRVNPRDYKLLKENVLDILQDKLSKNVKVVWKQDPEVMRGGCLLETDTQIIDATIENKLKEVGEILGVDCI